MFTYIDQWEVIEPSRTMKYASAWCHFVSLQSCNTQNANSNRFYSNLKYSDENMLLYTLHCWITLMKITEIVVRDQTMEKWYWFKSYLTAGVEGLGHLPGSGIICSKQSQFYESTKSEHYEIAVGRWRTTIKL